MLKNGGIHVYTHILHNHVQHVHTEENNVFMERYTSNTHVMAHGYVRKKKMNTE